MRQNPRKQPAESTVVIVGIVRNGSKTLKGEILKLSTAFSSFKSITHFIVESDSNDDTVSILNSLSNEISKFNFISLGNLSNSIPDRVDRISFCRNHYLEFVKKNSQNVDFVVVADLDGVNKDIDQSKILNAWENEEWDVCTANQSGPYYDIFALRASKWNESDCWTEARNLYKSGIHPAKAWKLAIRNKMKIIESNQPWIEVDSAFGGLAIYSIAAFLCGKYETASESEVGVCEHVPFNLAVRKSGFRIFINPKMINFDYNEHNDFRRLSRRIKFILKYAFSIISPNLFVRNVMPDMRIN